MDKINLRIARPEDAEALLEIYAPYVLSTAVSYEYTPPTVEEFRGRIEKTLTRYPYIVAELEGKVLGYAYAWHLSERKAGWHAAEVSIYVDRDSRRAGLGRLLYSGLEKILAMQNVVSVSACIAACDREKDEHLTKDSLLFHARCGYREVGRHPNCGYKFGKWYDLVWMEKSIGERLDNMPEMKFFPEIRESVSF